MLKWQTSPPTNRVTVVKHQAFMTNSQNYKRTLPSPLHVLFWNCRRCLANFLFRISATHLVTVCELIYVTVSTLFHQFSIRILHLQADYIQTFGTFFLFFGGWGGEHVIHFSPTKSGLWITVSSARSDHIRSPLLPAASKCICFLLIHCETLTPMYNVCMKTQENPITAGRYCQYIYKNIHGYIILTGGQKYICIFVKYIFHPFASVAFNCSQL